MKSIFQPQCFPNLPGMLFKNNWGLTLNLSEIQGGTQAAGLYPDFQDYTEKSLGQNTSLKILIYLVIVFYIWFCPIWGTLKCCRFLGPTLDFLSQSFQEWDLEIRVFKQVPQVKLKLALEESSNQVREPQNWFFFPIIFLLA